ncbi:carbamoyltransferase HypF [Geminocystis sp. NIES-3708]|uniref:carbamoyltransferase HypF n=1 Tax=Geminocystis sp. NIES-3708 TaxID=1615909 RepID=UPI000A838266|nr:carbamoyltransferase HypF [Geminocystis sp. NIES-3708]
MAKNCYQIIIKGIVQGIGFRPFIYTLAIELDLKGWVKNSGEGVVIEVELTTVELDIFITRIKAEKPLQSEIYSLEIKLSNWVGYQQFTIKNLDTIDNRRKTAIVLPDLSTCQECLEEIFNSQNRRYCYPFTNCTNCGPRYSIIKDLPYDRPFTTMSKFRMCKECEEEYYNPKNRRFHAQPNACQKCGPKLELWNKKGNILASFDEAIKKSCNLIIEGKILAVKGLGGFHLIADARHNEAIKILRQRKNRPHKPLAVMYPNLEKIKADCLVSDIEKNILLSVASPIVLLRKVSNLNNLNQKESFKNNPKIDNNYISEEVAPHNNYLGVMLPYTPLHHLLLKKLNFPIIATSGNQKNEPICIDEIEALDRLNCLADYFLIHNRPIFRAVDDSIVRVIDNQMMILRRGRGYAPLPIKLLDFPEEKPHKILALGGNLKNTIAIGFNQQIFTSQHIGDLDKPETIKAYKNTINNLSKIYEFQPDLIVCDAHPDYFSSQYAEELSKQKKPSIPVIQIQHHLAHIFATIAEHNLELPLLGIAWDGTGYGFDDTIWGGEFFYISDTEIKRIGSFLPFPLMGGSQAILQPKRIALALLNLVYNNFQNIPKNLSIIDSYSSSELKLFQTILDKKINTPLTSSVGRLFDGVASLLNIIDNITFEGQAAMNLEFLVSDFCPHKTYTFQWQHQENICNYIDWRSIIREIINDYLEKKSLSLIATKFHLTLVEIIKQISQTINTKNIVLSGGCFQNKFLLENTIQVLKQNHFNPYWSQKIPINDGGLSIGQIAFIIRNMR